MAAAFVQNTTKRASGSSQITWGTNAFGSAVTAGNTLLLALWWYKLGNSITSVVDSKGNTFTLDAERIAAVDANMVCSVYRCSNCAGGSGNVITTNLSGYSYITSVGIEVSGLANASPLDGSGSTNVGASTTQPTTGAFSTTHANDFILATFAHGVMSAWSSAPSGYTNIQRNTSSGSTIDGSVDYAVVSSVQSAVNLTWSITGNYSWASIVLAYKDTTPDGGILFPIQYGRGLANV